MTKPIMDHPISSDAIERLYPKFSAEVVGRLKAGAKDYGDRSFTETPEKLLHEMQQEAMDITGWGFILWCRLEALVEALERK